MRRTRSIAARLSLVFIFLFLLVILLGLFGLGSLSYFNGVSSQVQDRWLPSTRALGDLNNFTSDFRAAEAASLLVANPGELETREREMEALDRVIAAAQHRYAKIPHDSMENGLYARFASLWEEYRGIVRRVDSLSRTRADSAAVDLYNTTSKRAYDAASDTLGLLTDRNVASAEEASQRAQKAYKQARWLIVVTILLAGLLAAGAMAHVRRSISAPLLDLTRRMHRLAANETSLEIEGTARDDEIGEMARAVVVFRDNAIEVMNSRHGLAQQALMLQEKLAEERRLTLMQRNFVSMASHEFRTPLTIIDAHAQRLIAVKGSIGPEEIAERAGKARRAVRRITHLMDNLVSASRVAEGAIELYFHPANMDLTVLLREVCQLHREIVPRAQIQERFAAQPLLMLGDANLLFQAFSNLLANAIKYSPGGEGVNVTLVVEESRVAVCVEDHGIGIPAADCRRIFECYYRGTNVADIVGTGIGLYFVNMVIGLHDGEVSVESTEGEGSRFTVRLPRFPSRPDTSERLGDTHGSVGTGVHFFHVGEQPRAMVEDLHLVAPVERVGQDEIGHRDRTAHDELPLLHVSLHDLGHGPELLSGERHVGG
jgi:two-component system, OmpR family, sensor kinase